MKSANFLNYFCLMLCFFLLTGCGSRSNTTKDDQTAQTILETSAVETLSDGALPIISLEDESVQYGTLKLHLLKGYTCSVQGETIHLLKDGVVIGGIRYYPVPEVPFDYHIEWLRAMGLPEAQESEEPIAYMISNSVNSHMVAEFFHELEPETLNVEHNFYIDNEWVYDIYYDQNLLTDGKAEKLLRTVELNGILVAPEKPEEEISLQMCNAVLEMVRSGSYQIGIAQKNEGATMLNKSASTIYAAADENWISITEVPDDQSYHAYMSVNGSRYSNENIPGWESDGTVCWYTDPYPEDVYVPWLASFLWNEDLVSYTDTIEENAVKTIMLRIDEPLPGYEDLAECYFVDFHFTPEGVFLDAVITLDYLVDYELHTVEITELVLSLDADAVRLLIEKEYQRAIA